MHTGPQLAAGAKTVTRRLGWWFLKGGEEIRAVERARGLRKEAMRELRIFCVLTATKERLDRIVSDANYGREECRLEGYPELSPEQFVEMFCDTHPGVSPPTAINRIHFRFVK